MEKRKASLRRLFLNIGYNAYRTLGPFRYADLIFNFILNLPHIYLKKDLRALDKAMSRKIWIHFSNFKFCVDCAYIDKKINEDFFAFGGVRELYIRNCYFRYHNFSFEKIHNVIDIGGNRGLFSLLSANFCKKVIYIECQEKYNKALIHNMLINKLSNYAIENVFLGGRKDHGNNITLEDIIDKYNLAMIDFLKIDIEGSEFELFEGITCLDRVKYLSMEVHKDHGNIKVILNRLKEHNFNIKMCTKNFDLTSNINLVDFIYASKT
jgi:hypothetical protein